MLESFIRWFMYFFGYRDAIDPEGPFLREDWKPLLLWRFTEAAPGVKVYFTSRPGGISRPPYDSLNLGFHVGDDPGHVRGNRELLARTLGLAPDRLTSPRQRHTDQVSLLDNEADIGQGATAEESSFDPCDGLITTLTAAPLLLHFADCVPVVLSGVAEDGRPVAGVVHAGRQGLVEGVLANAAAMMVKRTGVALRDITAAIGPCIGPCCYQVDEGTASVFAGKFSGSVNDGYLDLQSAAAHELTGAGLWRSNIYTLEICTACNDLFYSYRRDGLTGRHGAIAWIEP